jgi:hypothetical protein
MQQCHVEIANGMDDINGLSAKLIGGSYDTPLLHSAAR